MTKMAECAEQLDAVYESDEEIKRILEEKDAQNKKKPNKNCHSNYLCRRGQEYLRSMTKKTFEVAVDNTGKRYVYQKITS